MNKTTLNVYFYGITEIELQNYYIKYVDNMFDQSELYKKGMYYFDCGKKDMPYYIFKKQPEIELDIRIYTTPNEENH